MRSATVGPLSFGALPALLQPREIDRLNVWEQRGTIALIVIVHLDGAAEIPFQHAPFCDWQFGVGAEDLWGRLPEGVTPELFFLSLDKHDYRISGLHTVHG